MLSLAKVPALWLSPRDLTESVPRSGVQTAGDQTAECRGLKDHAPSCASRPPCAAASLEGSGSSTRLKAACRGRKPEYRMFEGSAERLSVPPGYPRSTQGFQTPGGSGTPYDSAFACKRFACFAESLKEAERKRSEKIPRLKNGGGPSP